MQYYCWSIMCTLAFIFRGIVVGNDWEQDDCFSIPGTGGSGVFFLLDIQDDEEEVKLDISIIGSR